jgi:hypothetical protein
MRDDLREAIRQEVRHEVRQQIRHDGQRGASRHEPGPEFRVVLRPIASSLPLGFFAFTVGTVLLTALEGSFGHQVHQAEQEPGVRRHL